MSFQYLDDYSFRSSKSQVSLKSQIATKYEEISKPLKQEAVLKSSQASLTKTKYQGLLKEQQLFPGTKFLASNIDQYQIYNQLKTLDPNSTSITLKNVQIKELTQGMKIKLQSFKNLETLNLINLGLRNVENFPRLNNLETLNLRKNQIKDECYKQIIELYPNLVELNLRDNRIRCQKNIEMLEDSKLQELDLRENFISEKQWTAELAFDKIKSLMIFNGKYKDGKKANAIEFDEQLEDCLSSQSSIDFNNPDSDSEQDQKAKDAPSNYWYQPKATRNLRYMKNVTPEQKLRIKKRKSPYMWSSQLSKMRKLQKLQKLQPQD